MERLGSAISDSMSMLQLVTAIGWDMATCGVRTGWVGRGRQTGRRWRGGQHESLPGQRGAGGRASRRRRPRRRRTLFSVRTAAKRSTGLLLDRNSCSTVTAGDSSRVVTSRMLQIARAACAWGRRARGAVVVGSRAQAAAGRSGRSSRCCTVPTRGAYVATCSTSPSLPPHPPILPPPPRTSKITTSDLWRRQDSRKS